METLPYLTGPELESVDLKKGIVSNYSQMQQARSSQGDEILVELFEVRMNRDLESLFDLIPVLGRLGVSDGRTTA